jgi:hypothetical protein
MDVTQISQPPPATAREAPTAVTAPMFAMSAEPAPTYQQCDECAAPVDIDQRYCVSCGAHRRNVNDPAARYLSQATARSRSSRAAAPAKRHRQGGGVRGLGVALLLALIPAVAAVGVLVGRSSNNQDAKLIQALTRNEASRAAGGTAASSAATSTTAASSATTHTGAHAAKRQKKSSGTGSSAKGKQTGNSTTQFGSVSQIAGSKPTNAQKQQGAQDAQKVQKSTGKTYVNGQSSLPGTVVVP